MQCRAAHACRHTGLNRSPQQQDGHTDSDAVLDPWWLLSLLHGKQCDGEPAGADAVEGLQQQLPMITYLAQGLLSVDLIHVHALSVLMLHKLLCCD